MTLRTLMVAACLLTASVTTTLAATFSFSFDGDTTAGSIAGTVTGRILGLSDNGVNQQATNVFIDSAPAALGGPALSFDLLTLNNTAGNFGQFFTVVGGVLTGASLAFQGNVPPITSAQASGFVTFTLGSSYAGFNNSLTFNNGGTIIGNTGGFGGVTFANISAVPLPAGGILLISGLAGVAALKRRKKRAA